MTNNPFAADKRTEDSAVNKMRFTRGTVLEVPDSTDAEIPHLARVQPRGRDTQVTAPVATGVHGDVSIPEVGSAVLLARFEGGFYVVIGTVYTSDTNSPPPYKEGHRVVGNGSTDAELRITDEGDIEVYADSGARVTISGDTVTVDGGTVELGGSGGNGVITDISTTKDADGHVTDISLTRSSTVNVN